MKTEKPKKYSEHSKYLEIVKKLLKADFVGWITEGDKKSLKIKVKKNVHILPMEGEITEDTYKDLVRKLLTPDVQSLNEVPENKESEIE